MNQRNTLATALLLAVAFCAPAFAQAPPADTTVRADAQVEKIAVDMAKYIGEIDRALAMAKDGGYGKLERGSEARLTRARQTIGDLLQNVSDPRTLPPDQRIELFNAHEEIATILHHQDKARVVCTRERKTGSRLSTTECLTVGEREERARISSELARETQRELCVPGETSSCAK